MSGLTELRPSWRHFIHWSEKQSKINNIYGSNRLCISLEKVLEVAALHHKSFVRILEKLFDWYQRSVPSGTLQRNDWERRTTTRTLSWSSKQTRLMTRPPTQLREIWKNFYKIIRLSTTLGLQSVKGFMGNHMAVKSSRLSRLNTGQLLS